LPRLHRAGAAVLVLAALVLAALVLAALVLAALVLALVLVLGGRLVVVCRCFPDCCPTIKQTQRSFPGRLFQISVVSSHSVQKVVRRLLVSWRPAVVNFEKKKHFKIITSKTYLDLHPAVAMMIDLTDDATGGDSPAAGHNGRREDYKKRYGENYKHYHDTSLADAARNEVLIAQFKLEIQLESENDHSEREKVFTAAAERILRDANFRDYFKGQNPRQVGQEIAQHLRNNATNNARRVDRRNTAAAAAADAAEEMTRRQNLARGPPPANVLFTDGQTRMIEKAVKQVAQRVLDDDEYVPGSGWYEDVLAIVHGEKPGLLDGFKEEQIK
jgi:hypothetical protein